MMTSTDVVADEDVSKRKVARACAWRRVTAHGGVWRSSEARGGAWRHVTAHGARDQPYRNFERRVGAHAVSDGVEAFMVL